MTKIAGTPEGRRNSASTARVPRLRATAFIALPVTGSTTQTGAHNSTELIGLDSALLSN